MNYQEKINEEINLIDYVRVILKKKWLILIVFLITMIAAWFFTVSMPKIYRTVTSLEITGETEVPQQIIEKINTNVYGFKVQEKLGISEQDYLKVKAKNPTGTGLITAEIESADPQKAKDILTQMNNCILEDYQERTKGEKQLLEGQIELIKKNIEILNKDITRNKAKVSSLEEEKKNLEAKVEALQAVLVYEQTPGTQFALFDTKEKLEEKKGEIEQQYLNMNSLENGINALENQISSLQFEIENIQPIRIIKSPTASEKPIEPRPLLNMVVASVLGLFLGTFLAFSLEWWEKNKARI